MTSFFINSDSITAFNTLTRAAKYIETKKPEAAVQFYKKAADLYKMEGGRIREAADVLGRVFVLFFILFFCSKCEISDFSQILRRRRVSKCVKSNILMPSRLSRGKEI